MNWAMKVNYKLKLICMVSGERPSTVETSVFSPNATHLHNLITAGAPVQLRTMSITILTPDSKKN